MNKIGKEPLETCPECGWDLSWNSINIEEGQAEQEVVCQNCGTEYVEVYIFDHWEKIER